MTSVYCGKSYVNKRIAEAWTREKADGKVPVVLNAENFVGVFRNPENGKFLVLKLPREGSMSGRVESLASASEHWKKEEALTRAFLMAVTGRMPVISASLD
ncbi:MAG: hypothetical protein V4489_09395 [Chlamydiota bacterium]